MSMLALAGCRKREILVYPEIPDIPKVLVLFPPDGLGDQSYSDQILSTLFRLTINSDNAFDLTYVCPSDDSPLDSIFVEALNQCRHNTEMLLILGGNDSYEELVKRHCKADDPVSQRVLFYDSANPLPVNTINFTSYGVSFLVGAVAFDKLQADTAAYLGACADCRSILYEFRDGFIDGYTSAAAEQGRTVVVKRLYIADDFAGFDMADSVYRMADDIFASSPFVYTVAGGSIMGLFRYLREPMHRGYFTAGMDVDQSHLAAGVLMSVRRRVDSCLADYVTQWISSGTLPKGARFDLESPYLDVSPSPRYADELKPMLDRWRNVAKQREQEYLFNKN